MKRVLITGQNSYIGTSFEQYVYANYAEQIKVNTLDMTDPSWRDTDFSVYDAVFHVAGIAHADVGNVTDDIKAKYYAVNTDLAIETAHKAKKEGIKQFIFMSSAIIYGDSAPYGTLKRIELNTEPSPSNFYGDSKWQADKGIRALADDSFKVSVIRSPMIYGKGSRGNYISLAIFAKKLSVFPDIQNERSMLYVENLCEFLVQIILAEKDGIFFPQNAAYTTTSEMVRLIAQANHHKINVSKSWNWLVSLASKIPGKPSILANKAFGNMSYDQSMSKYEFDYQIYDLKQSIERTEG